MNWPEVVVKVTARISEAYEYRAFLAYMASISGMVTLIILALVIAHFVNKHCKKL